MRETDIDKRNQVLWLRNLYRSYVDNSFELMWHSTLDDRIIFCNRVFVQALGFITHKKAKDHPLTTIVENPDEYTSLKEKLLLDKELRQYKLNLKKLSGQPLIALVNAQLVLDDKNEYIISWTAIDISQRIEQEKSLEAKNNQLTKINSQMEHFLYSTSHDLRSPLTTIMGLTNLLRFECADKSVLEYINRIEDCTEKLDKIIKDIISFSKMTYKNVHTRLIDFHKMINPILAEYIDKQLTKNPEVEITITGDYPFYSDHDRIRIILDNLIRNAFQFQDANKVKPFIHIKIVQNVQYVSIDIYDNGIGIPEKYLTNIFKMFFKASVLSKGAGLGLYITKEGVEQLGGTLNVHSEVGFGSVFKITLPNSAKGRLINRKISLLKNQY